MQFANDEIPMGLALNESWNMPNKNPDKVAVRAPYLYPINKTIIIIRSGRHTLISSTGTKYDCSKNAQMIINNTFI